MLAAASFNISWVDPLILIVVVLGVIHGRKRGMSEELLDIIKWTLIVLFAGILYGPCGRWLSQLATFSLLSSYVFTYLLIALAIFLAFSVIKGKVGDKLIGSDVFGSAEYYLGMIAGGYRFFCIVLVVMAFLNARHYDAAEIAAADKFQDDNFGTKLLPSMPDLQKEVFEQSVTGRIAQNYLYVVLIRPTAPGLGGGRPVPRQRNGAVDQILDKK